MSTVTVVTWLEIHDDDAIRWLRINRPDRRNAIPVDGFPQLRDAFVDFEKSDQRVLVLTGRGGAFCAGADLNVDSLGEPRPVVGQHQRMKVVEAAATALHRISKPTIAGVDGVAVGAGMNMALGCDVVIAAESARFSEIFVRRGLTVDFAGTWLLPRHVGLQRAKELALSGRIVEADEAVRIGIAMEVVPVGELEQRVREVADGFIAGAPLAQMFTKQALDASFGMSFSEAVSWEGQSQSIAFATEDANEGITAFLDKRDPEWRGR